MNTFNYTELANGEVYVTDGADRHVVLQAQQWYEVKAQMEHSDASAEFDKAVEDFFAPLMDAMEKLETADKPQLDSAFYVVINEGEAGTPGVVEEIIHLDRDSAIARLVMTGQHERLIWIGNDKIAVTAVKVEAADAVVADVVDPVTETDDQA